MDRIGGLLTAIAVAKEKAGLSQDESINLIEMPQDKGLFNLPIPSISAKEKIQQDPALRYLELLTKHPGVPLFMMTPDMYPLLQE